MSFDQNIKPSSKQAPLVGFIWSIFTVDQIVLRNLTGKVWFGMSSDSEIVHVHVGTAQMTSARFWVLLEP